MNGYNLIRNWYAFKFDNPSKCKAIHSDMYCYLVDLWNRLGQKNEFGLPTQMTMEVLGIGSYNTYKKALDSLIEFGFVIIVSDSINQHQSKVVALSNFDKATYKALDKATIKATDEATDKATDTIYKPINQVTNKPKNNSGSFKKTTPLKTILQRKEDFKEKVKEFINDYDKQELIKFYEYWSEAGDNDKKMKFEKEKSFNCNLRIKKWFANKIEWQKDKTQQSTSTLKQTPIEK